MVQDFSKNVWVSKISLEFQNMFPCFKTCSEKKRNFKNCSRLWILFQNFKKCSRFNFFGEFHKNIFRSLKNASIFKLCSQIKKKGILWTMGYSMPYATCNVRSWSCLYLAASETLRDIDTSSLAYASARLGWRSTLRPQPLFSRTLLTFNAFSFTFVYASKYSKYIYYKTTLH